MIHPVVVFLGDSITRSGMYVDYLQKRYLEATLIKSGVDGERAPAGAARLPSVLAKYHPVTCVVCYGMNDALSDPAHFLPGMRSIIKQLQAADIAITILTAPPANNKKFSTAAVAEQAKSLALEFGVLCADCQAAESVGNYPTAEGHRLMADVLEHVWKKGTP